MGISKDNIADYIINYQASLTGWDEGLSDIEEKAFALTMLERENSLVKDEPDWADHEAWNALAGKMYEVYEENLAFYKEEGDIIDDMEGEN